MGQYGNDGEGNSTIYSSDPDMYDTGWNVLAYISSSKTGTFTFASLRNFGTLETDATQNMIEMDRKDDHVFGGMFNTNYDSTIVKEFQGVIHTVWSIEGQYDPNDLEADFGLTAYGKLLHHSSVL